MHISSTQKISKFKTTLLIIFLFVPFQNLRSSWVLSLTSTRSPPPSLPRGYSRPSSLPPTTLLQRLTPQAIKHVKILDGGGGPGTIKKVTFGEGKLTIFVYLYYHVYLTFLYMTYFTYIINWKSIVEDFLFLLLHMLLN